MFDPPINRKGGGVRVLAEQEPLPVEGPCRVEGRLTCMSSVSPATLCAKPCGAVTICFNGCAATPATHGPH